MIEGALLWRLWRRHRPPVVDEDLDEPTQDRDGRIPGLVDEAN
ncbi:hypothetical protein [Streptosporangium jomthongense]|uniref:Uncharacterized protein n=1 Tax=Streptosporangium jomthongense TaxID=1193683 RepID=A0ABV8FFH7_9ACTN